MASFRDNPTSTTIKVVPATSAQFPAVTVCNLNPYRNFAMNRVAGANELIRSLLDTSSSSVSPGTFLFGPPPGSPYGPETSSSDTSNIVANTTATNSTAIEGTNSTATYSTSAVGTQQAPSGPAGGGGPSGGGGPPGGRGKRQLGSGGGGMMMRGPPTVYKRTQSIDAYRSQILTAKMSFQTLELLEDAGYQQHELLAQCVFDKYMCDNRDISLAVSSTYGNCFTFNAQLTADSYNNAINYVVTRKGSGFGLELTLNAHISSYIDMMAPAGGFRIQVHDPQDLPYPEIYGTAIRPGEVTFVSVRKKEMTRVENELCTTREYVSQNVYNKKMGEQIITTKYTQETCMRLCVQETIQIGCQCGLGIFGYLPPNVTQCTEDRDSFECVTPLLAKALNVSLPCQKECLPQCHTIGYSTELSYAAWPQEGDVAELYGMMRQTVMDMNQLREQDVETGRIPQHARMQLARLQSLNETDAMKLNLARIIIYFNDLSTNAVVEDYTYSGDAFISNVGGLLGLYMGVSILTLCEVVPFVIRAIALAFLPAAQEVKKNGPDMPAVVAKYSPAEVSMSEFTPRPRSRHNSTNSYPRRY